MVKIYLADLTHTTITISNDSFPLNIGLITSYLKNFYPALDITLFKYPETLKEAIDKNPPDVLALSNYPWNKNLDLCFFKYVKNKNSKCITVMGGPNISYNKTKQYEFLIINKNVLDFYCLYEGETSFKNLIDAAVKHNYDLDNMKRDQIKGSIYLKDYPQHSYDEFLMIGSIDRLDDLDKIPSPYLSGILDKFFDGKLSPLIETHRGCPFTCTYCHEGFGYPKRITQYPSDRIKRELDYIADHVGKKVDNLMFADPNFGIFDHHIGIAEKIKQIHDRTNYPKTIFASTAKNKKENLVKISKILRGISMPIWMSVQSMTGQVLKNIKRNNISVGQMIQVQKELERNKINSKSELILGLPGESYATHIDSLVKLMEMKMRQIIIYQLMLVNGSEIAESDTRSIFDFRTKYRAIPRSISQLEGMEKAIEVEEIVVSTKDLSFFDYLQARKLHLLVSTFYNGKIFDAFFRIIEENSIKLFDFIVQLNNAFLAHPRLQIHINNFIQDTEDELFESEQEVLRYYSDEKNFQDFLSGRRGGNLLQKYSSLFYMEYVDHLIDVIADAAFSMHTGSEYKRKIENIKKFYHLLFKYYLDSDRDKKICEESFDYNINAWLESNKEMNAFLQKQPVVLLFYTPADQYIFLENYFGRYGRNPQAFGKIMTRAWISEMTRKVRIKKA